MPGENKAPYRQPCAGYGDSDKIYLGCNQHTIEAHRHVDRKVNTTLASTAPCSPATDAAPTPRQANPDTGHPEVPICVDGVPSGMWAEPVPTNTYGTPGSGATTVDLSACRKRGFKNVIAGKNHHGATLPMSSDNLGYSSVHGDGTCPLNQLVRGTPDRTRYRGMNCTAKYTSSDGTTDTVYSIATTCEIDRLSGYATGSYAESGDMTATTRPFTAVDRNIKSALGTLISQVAAVSPTTILGLYYDGTVASYFDARSLPNPAAAGGWTTVTYVDGAVASYEAIYTDGLGESITQNGEIDCANRSVLITKTNSATGEYTEVRFSTTGTTQTYKHRYEGGSGGWEEMTCDLEYFAPYTTANVESDVNDLLATWNLCDDAQYPWRTDTDSISGILNTTAQGTTATTSGGPLVTRNERASRAPFVWPEPVDGVDYTDPTLPPRTDISDGGIVGAPLPAGYEPFFDFYHIKWLFETDVSHGISASPEYYGAFSPFPHATQWLDNQMVRWFPSGPFICYGGVYHPEFYNTCGHYGRLMTSTLYKNKWHEVIDPSPSHNFFRPCGADRDVESSPGVLRWPTAWPICGRVAVLSMTQNAGNVDVVLSEPAPYLRTGDVVDFTTYGATPTFAETVAVSNKTVTVTDSTHFSYAGTVPVSLPTHCKSHSAPHYKWNDTKPKGDYLFKTWVFDFRDFLESYRVRAYAASLDAAPSCGTITWPDPVRYTAVTPDDPEGGFNEIGTGARWISSLTVADSCVRLQPCCPAVVRIGGSDTSGCCNQYGIAWNFAGAVDPIYGTLIVGRISRMMNDPLATAGWEEARNTLPTGAPSLPADAIPLEFTNYISNLNSGTPNLNDCEPQYEYQMVFDSSGCAGAPNYYFSGNQTLFTGAWQV